MEIEKKEVSRVAFNLGIAGLIPFVCLAVRNFAVVSVDKNIVLFGLLAYGASICSFLGAIHWGLVMRDTTPDTFLFLWGIVPSLISWVSLIIKPELGLYLISALLWVCLFIDSKIYPKYGLKHWLPMRLLLTSIASLSCFISATF